MTRHEWKQLAWDVAMLPMILFVLIGFAFLGSLRKKRIR